MTNIGTPGTTIPWQAISLEVGTVAAKVLRSEWAFARAERLRSVHEVYCQLHVTISGHNGCAEKCWQAAVEEGERRIGPVTVTNEPHPKGGQG